MGFAGGGAREEKFSDGEKEEEKEKSKEEERSRDWADQVEEEERSSVIEALSFKLEELCSQIKLVKAMEEDENSKPKALKENDMDKYIKATKREISKRRKLIDLLGQGRKYYDVLYQEAKIIETAYRNFGQKIKNVSVKLAEQKGLASKPSLS